MNVYKPPNASVKNTRHYSTGVHEAQLSDNENYQVHYTGTRRYKRKPIRPFPIVGNGHLYRVIIVVPKVEIRLHRKANVSQPTTFVVPHDKRQLDALVCLQGSQVAGGMLDATLLWVRFLGGNDSKQRNVGLPPHIRYILVCEELYRIGDGAVERSDQFQALLEPLQQYADEEYIFHLAIIGNLLLEHSPHIAKAIDDGAQFVGEPLREEPGDDECCEMMFSIFLASTKCCGSWPIPPGPAGSSVG
uniref:Uncharacterized protein n=1 Tax=Anopheles merus TaxID=30066 RepID=A0A182V4B1_ANOME